jgi:DNA-binding MarR family transcriptional regulator
MTTARRPLDSRGDLALLADRLHSAAIHLLRRLRREDPSMGLSAPRASALSVIVFGGPVSPTALAEAEQVALPTISRLVRDLERDGLVVREPDPDDGRAQRLRATARGRKLLDEGRRRRVAALTADLAALPTRELAALGRAAATLERVAGGATHDRRPSGANRGK